MQLLHLTFYPTYQDAFQHNQLKICYLDSSEIKNSNWKTRKLKKKNPCRISQGPFNSWNFSIFSPGLKPTVCVMRMNSLEFGTCTARTGRPITPCASHQLFWHMAWWDQTHIAKATGTIMMELVTHIIMCKLLSSCSGGLFFPFLFPLFYFHRLGEPTKCTAQRKEIDRIRSASECWTITPHLFLWFKFKMHGMKFRGKSKTLC